MTPTDTPCPCCAPLRAEITALRDAVAHDIAEAERGDRALTALGWLATRGRLDIMRGIRDRLDRILEAP